MHQWVPGVGKGACAESRRNARHELLSYCAGRPAAHLSALGHARMRREPWAPPARTSTSASTCSIHHPRTVGGSGRRQGKQVRASVPLWTGSPPQRNDAPLPGERNRPTPPEQRGSYGFEQVDDDASPNAHALLPCCQTISSCRPAALGGNRLRGRPPAASVAKKAGSISHRARPSAASARPLEHNGNRNGFRPYRRPNTDGSFIFSRRD